MKIPQLSFEPELHVSFVADADFQVSSVDEDFQVSFVDSHSSPDDEPLDAQVSFVDEVSFEPEPLHAVSSLENDSHVSLVEDDSHASLEELPDDFHVVS